MFKLLNVSKESMFDVILRLDCYKKIIEGRSCFYIK